MPDQPPSDDEIRREFLWMWDPFHSLPRAGLLVLYAAAFQAHGVLFDPRDPVLMGVPSLFLVGLGG